MNCPYCQNPVSAPDLWEFFDCPQCGAALQLENEEIKLLKEPQKDLHHSPEDSPPQNPAEEESPTEAPMPLEENKEAVVDPPPIDPPPAPPDENPTHSIDELDEHSSEDPSPLLETTPQNDPASSDLPLNSENSATNPEPALDPSENPPPVDQELGFANSENSATDQEPAANEESLFQENALEQPSHTDKPSPADLPPIDPPSAAAAPSPDDLQTEEEDPNLSSIADFGNAPLEKNHFVYDLTISHIDSADCMARLKNILTTERLKLDTSQELSKIQDGILVLSSLNAVQTMYIVRQLSASSLALSWVQKSKL